MQSKAFALAAFTLGRIGVPLFMFISGYLLLDRVYDWPQTKKFWLRNLLPLLLTTEIWLIIYNIFLFFWQQQQFNAAELIKSILLLKRLPLMHMWYLPMLLGVYCFLPAIANLLRSCPVKIYLLPLLLALVYYTVVPVVDVFLRTYGYHGVARQLALEFSGGYYGLSFLVGYYYKKYGSLWQLKTVKLGALIIIGLFLTWFSQFNAYTHKLRYNVWYNSIFLLTAAFGLFLLGAKIKGGNLGEKFKLLTHALARLAFGVFLLHVPVLLILKKFLAGITPLPLQVIVMCFSALFISVVFILPFLKLPQGWRRVIFYYK